MFEPPYNDFASANLFTRWERAGFRVSAECRAASMKGGGDFYTVAVRGPGHIGVVIGDVCGRGAEGHVLLSKILPTIHQLAQSETSPAALLTILNQEVVDGLPMDRFVTAAAFELDLRLGALTLANAAHVPAIVRRARGRGVYVVGPASGMPLGLAKETTYREERCELNRGDVIVLMTDGVLEAVEADLVTMSTFKRLVGEAVGGGSDVHRFLLQKLEARITEGRADDMTLLALEAAPRPSFTSRQRVEQCAYLS